MNDNLYDLYIGYLPGSSGSVTAAGLSDMADGRISHDKITRLLSRKPETSADLRRAVRPPIRQSETADGVLIAVHHLTAGSIGRTRRFRLYIRFCHQSWVENADVLVVDLLGSRRSSESGAGQSHETYGRKATLGNFHEVLDPSQRI